MKTLFVIKFIDNIVHFHHFYLSACLLKGWVMSWLYSYHESRHKTQRDWQTNRSFTARSCWSQTHDNVNTVSGSLASSAPCSNSMNGSRIHANCMLLGVHPDKLFECGAVQMFHVCCRSTYGAISYQIATF